MARVLAPFPMSQNRLRDSRVFRSALLLAAAPPLVYCVAFVYFESYVRGLGFPRPGPWMALVALTGATVAVATNSIAPRGAPSWLLRLLELLVRYALALLVIQYALNKLIPGQFLLYNRDLDLPLRELPTRRLAWHFLGYSQLYNGFIASCELVAGVLLLSRRTVLGGAMLSLFTLINIVVIDTAFGLRGALPIATVMAFAALAIVICHLDPGVLKSLLWHPPEDHRLEARSLPARLTRIVTLGIVLGFPLYMNLGARRGLGGQVPAAGRWEVLECNPDPGWAMCRSEGSKGRSVLYIEVGQWGQLLTGSDRRDLAFRYDRLHGVLKLRIAAGSRLEPELMLEGTVRKADTTVILNGVADGQPFQVHLQRTHWAPWPPVRVF